MNPIQNSWYVSYLNIRQYTFASFLLVALTHQYGLAPTITCAPAVF